MYTKDKNNNIPSLDYRIIAEEEGFWIAEAGLPFMLRIPKESVRDGDIGKYITPGRIQFTNQLKSENKRSHMAELLKAHINEDKPVTLYLKHKDSKNDILFLSCDEWPDFTFSAKKMHYADRRRLLDGEKVKMKVIKKDGSAPEVETIKYIFVESIDGERPEKGGIYNVVITKVYPNRLFVEANGYIGTIEKNDMNPRKKYVAGMFIDAECTYADHTGKKYNYSPVAGADSSEYYVGKQIEGTINHYDEEDGRLYVNFGEFTNQWTYCGDSLNAASWIESGLFGDTIRLKINKIREGSKHPYSTELFITRDGDPYNLPLGTKLTIDYSPGDKYIRFVHNGRNYGLYKDSLHIPDILKGLIDGDVHLNGVVIKEFGSKGYSDPDIAINSYRQFCHDLEKRPSKQFTAEVIGSSDTGTVVKTDDGYYLNIFDNSFDVKWPRNRRPAKGETITCIYDTVPDSYNPDKKKIIPLYDQSTEVDYKLPQGHYTGKAVCSYLDDRFVVETDKGRVTAVCEAPWYIIGYFYRNDTPVEVDVDADGNALMRFCGVNYDAEIADGTEMQIKPIDRISGGIIVEFKIETDTYYGYIYAEDFEWTHFYDIDLDEKLRMLSQADKNVARKISKPDKKGIFFSMKDADKNPYKATEFDNLGPGSEVDVTVEKHLMYSNLLVDYKGVKGIIYCNNTGRFRLSENRPARYIGETIKARVEKFDREEGKLEFTANSVKYEKLESVPAINKECEVTVRGHAGDDVIVQCGNVIGSLSNSMYLYEEIFVTPSHFPAGTKLKAVCKKLERKDHDRNVFCVFSVTEEWRNSFSKIYIRVRKEDPVSGTVAGYCDEGLVITFPFRNYRKAYGILPRMAAMELVNGPCSDLRNAFAIGDEITIVPAFPVKSKRIVYVLPANCRLIEEYSKAKDGTYTIRGTIKSFDRTEGYIVALDNGLTGFMNAESSSHSLWYTDILPVGAAMEFLMYSADFTTYRPLLNRKMMIPNPWDSIGIKEGDVVDIDIVGVSGDILAVSYCGVHDYIESWAFAGFAGRPWDEDYKLSEHDFPKGKAMKARVAKTDVAKRHCTLQPYFPGIEKDASAEVVAIAPHGLWVRIPGDGGTTGFVPDAEISHAGIRAADGLFKAGDAFHVRFIGMPEGGYIPRLSRKALIDPKDNADKLLLENHIK